MQSRNTDPTSKETPQDSVGDAWSQCLKLTSRTTAAVLSGEYWVYQQCATEDLARGLLRELLVRQVPTLRVGPRVWVPESYCAQTCAYIVPEGRAKLSDIPGRDQL
jgi:hypothetical protein